MQYAAAAVALWVLFVAVGCSREVTTRSDLPGQPEVLTTDYATLRARQARTRATALPDGECVSQSDCASDEVCVAIAPSHAECMQRGDKERPKPAPNGRPAPPLRLLDGQVLRDHAEQSAR